jgi:hypothetical protein
MRELVSREEYRTKQWEDSLTEWTSGSIGRFIDPVHRIVEVGAPMNFSLSGVGFPRSGCNQRIKLICWNNGKIGHEE